MHYVQQICDQLLSNIAVTIKDVSVWVVSVVDISMLILGPVLLFSKYIFEQEHLPQQSSNLFITDAFLSCGLLLVVWVSLVLNDDTGARANNVAVSYILGAAFPLLLISTITTCTYLPYLSNYC